MTITTQSPQEYGYDVRVNTAIGFPVATAVAIDDKGDEFVPVIVLREGKFILEWELPGRIKDRAGEVIGA